MLNVSAFLLFICWLIRDLKSVFIHTSARMFSSGFSSDTFEKPWYLISSYNTTELFLGFFFFHEVKIFHKAFTSDVSKHLTLHNQFFCPTDSLQRSPWHRAVPKLASDAGIWTNWNSICGELQGRRIPMLQLLSSMKGQEFVCIPKLFALYWWKFPMK